LTGGEEVRLDKFLKISRIIKRRTVAKEVCDKGKIEVNGRPAKPAAEVQAGDTLVIRFGRKTLEVKILATPAAVRAGEAADIYRVIAETYTGSAGAIEDW
jgi:ribosomal 50S subunit-recycling heat shock protein